MGKKPAALFGGIAFSKDGRVRSEVEALPDDQKGQELRAVTRLLVLEPSLFPEGSAIEPPPEDDHDVAVRAPSGELLVKIQCVEIVYRDFAWKLTRDEYDSGRHQRFIQMEFGGLPWAVDDTKATAVIAERLEHKLAKHYAPVAGAELWLLIWAGSAGMILSSGFHQGQYVVSKAVAHARAIAGTRSIAPFDRVLFFNLVTRPEGIYPPGWLAQ